MPGTRSRRRLSDSPRTVLSNSEWVLFRWVSAFFQAAGLILLVSMIGAIVLTLRHKQKAKRQNIAAQVARTKATAIEIVKVRPGQGVS